MPWALKERPGTAGVRSKYETVLLAATILTALSSIFFGHIILTTMIEMLSNDFLDLHASKIILSVRAQYLLLVIAVLCLVAFVAESFDSSDSRGQKKSTR